MTGQSRRASAKKKLHRRRLWRNLLFLLIALSLFQYFNDGKVSWPKNVAEKVSDNLRDYAGRPEASWREATEKLEELGSEREGNPLPDFGLTGRVVRVADGDTLSVLDRNNKQHKIRLHGIDTPERDQPYGRAAWDALDSMVDGKAVGVVVLGEDSYGRTDGTVYLGDRNINVAMVAGGHAWWYRYYAPHDRLLAATEEKARSEKRGLWAQPNPVPPWDWRREQKYSKP